MVETDGKAQLEKLEYPQECKSLEYLLYLYGRSGRKTTFASIWLISGTKVVLRLIISSNDHADSKLRRECDYELVAPLDRHGCPVSLTGYPTSGNEIGPGSIYFRPRKHFLHIPGGISARCLCFIPRMDHPFTIQCRSSCTRWVCMEHLRKSLDVATEREVRNSSF